jgi:hypothetical protein
MSGSECIPSRLAAYKRARRMSARRAARSHASFAMCASRHSSWQAVDHPGSECRGPRKQIIRSRPSAALRCRPCALVTSYFWPASGLPLLACHALRPSRRELKQWLRNARYAVNALTQPVAKIWTGSEMLHRRTRPKPPNGRPRMPNAVQSRSGNVPPAGGRDHRLLVSS